MALSKQNVVKTAEVENQEREEKLVEYYNTYEQKIDRRLVRGVRQFIFQIDSRVALEAMRKLVGNYRKGQWNVEIAKKGQVGQAHNQDNQDLQKVALQTTGVWVLKFS